MKKILVSILSLVAMLAATASVAYATPVGFNGYYDYATWTKSSTHRADTTSTIDTAQQTLTLMEPDNGYSTGLECYYSGEGCVFNFSHAVASSGTVSFNWAFDWGIDPCCSGFNVYINSTMYNLADGHPGDRYHVNGATNGVFSASVNAGDTITFSAFSADACCGAAHSTVSNFDAPSQVPEPSTIALFGAAVGGLGVVARRKKNAKKA